MPIDAIFRGGEVEPDAGQPVDPRALELERGQRPDQRLLQVAAVLPHVAAVAVEVEDRVADELARPVEGGLAAAVGLDDLDLGALGHVQLLVAGAAAERDHRRVLEEDHRVGDRALRDRGGERALELPGLEVRRLAEVTRVRHRLASGAARQVRGEAVAPAVEEDRPALDALHAEHPVCGPVVLGEPCADRLLGRRVDDVQRLAVALERAAEEDEAVLDERVHEARVLVPAVLLAQVARPVPGPPRESRTTQSSATLLRLSRSLRARSRSSERTRI